MKKKMVLLVTVLALVLCGTIGGTLAWLVDKTTEVKNTFTHGNINIELDESDDLDFKMIPGNEIKKDPVVEVVANSEACWLFVEIKESINFDDFLSYEIADGWTLYNTTTVGENINTVEQDSYVIYCKVDSDTAKTGVKYSVIAEDKVTVPDTVSKDMMNTIDGIDDAGNSVQAELDSRPTLTFTAYAVQSENVNTVAEAWVIAKPSTTT